jgi:hypothetical protein
MEGDKATQGDSDAAHELKTRNQFELQIKPVNAKTEHTVKLKLRNEDTVLAVLGFLAIVFGLIEQDKFFHSDYHSSSTCDALRVVVMLLSAMSCVIVIRRYRTLLRLQKVRQKLSQGDTLISSKLYRMMGLELVINMAHCPPKMDWTFDVETMKFTMTYSVDTIMTMLLMLRVYLIVRLFSEYSKFMARRAEMVMRWYGLEASTPFAVKGYIYENPLLSVGIIFGSMSVFWSIIVMLFEQPDRHYNAHYADTKGFDSTLATSVLDDFSNCLWMVFVTTTTGKA